ncbi:hypothetical protein FRC12_001311 [Ceratobasidium sp. 428]|nr:hypothetical protein FRC12_001311 [Ceratobasidium sp. 428]
MGEDDKKRRLDDEDEAAWNKAKAEAFVKEVEELQEAIKYADSDTFTESLADSLDEVSTKTVQLVKELVAPILLDGYEDSRHCVRCHEAYTEKDNHASACITLCNSGAELRYDRLLWTSFQEYRHLELFKDHLYRGKTYRRSECGIIL